MYMHMYALGRMLGIYNPWYIYRTHSIRTYAVRDHAFILCLLAERTVVACVWKKLTHMKMASASVTPGQVCVLSFQPE